MLFNVFPIGYQAVAFPAPADLLIERRLSHWVIRRVVSSSCEHCAGLNAGDRFDLEQFSFRVFETVLQQCSGYFSEVSVRVREGLADTLHGAGVDVIFGLMGNANQNLMCDLGFRHRMQVVCGRRESAVVSMADGFARSSGRFRVATVTAGPGLTNTGTALAVARGHGSPGAASSSDRGATRAVRRQRPAADGPSKRTDVHPTARGPSALSAVGDQLCDGFTGGRDSAAVTARLADEHWIYVRDLAGFELPGWIRVTIGTRHQIEYTYAA
ncbi:thiamine pyrophosphate-binding protein [Nocardia vinacea]|uniref:acetolactate synthase n=1 Tax=Nocardia vinacea TaxID=96468 RepID=A0ABZ1YT57_9NOCA|nr:thiamine pyrophosphate-binding protein [Nocardia vinacea]